MERFETRLFELSSEARGGKRPIKMILHRIMDSPDDYQDNGVSWNEEYVREAAARVDAADIAVEYLSKGMTAEDTEISGHGFAGETLDADGKPMPTFNADSEVVGTITKAYITTVELNGAPTKVLMADGFIYEHRHPGLVAWLKEHVPNGDVMGSVEIVGCPENNNEIVYADGYKPKGRVPMRYEYAGYAILSASVEPADKACYVLEINENKGDECMDETKAREFVDEIKQEIHAVLDENTRLTAEINELNEQADAKVAELNEANAQIAQLQQALEQVKAEMQAKCDEFDEKWAEHDREMDALRAERNTLQEAIAKYKVQERLNSLNQALAPFTVAEQNEANEMIEAFKADPMNHEINEITTAILAGIGRRAKEAEKKASEQNAKAEPESIESVVEPEKTLSSASIF